MKIVINGAYGGFQLPMEFWDDIDDEFGDLETTRTDPRLLEYVENKKEEYEKYSFDLKVVEIPDNATDYRIHDYDGCEWIDAVVDGKIVEIR